MKTFNTLQELRDEFELNDAADEWLEFVDSCNNLQEVFQDCSFGMRLWSLRQGYEQFADDCNWGVLADWQWDYLLAKQPHFSKFRKGK